MDDQRTLSFAEFWSWLLGHPDCILRAGTPEAILYDDEELHWSFTEEEPRTVVAQLLRGKLLVGELLIAPDQIAYVQALTPDREDEFVFELVTESETENELFPAYFFVLVHGYSGDRDETVGRVH
jgi:hypothetical protein